MMQDDRLAILRRKHLDRAVELVQRILIDMAMNAVNAAVASDRRRVMLMSPQDIARAPMPAGDVPGSAVQPACQRSSRGQPARSGGERREDHLRRVFGV